MLNGAVRPGEADCACAPLTVSEKAPHHANASTRRCTRGENAIWDQIDTLPIHAPDMPTRSTALGTLKPSENGAGRTRYE